MKRPIAALALALMLAAPAGAQISDDEAKAFVARYVQLFNKGDAQTLATEVYAIPNTTSAALEAKLTAQFEALRSDEFGKMVLFGSTTCKQGADDAKIELSFAYQYTYGGNMPPGDLASVMTLHRTDKGWRITASDDLKPGMKMVCPV